MSTFVLSCCSTADMSKKYFEKRDIHYACFHYSINGKQYKDDLGQSMPLAKFYETIKDKNTDLKTSQVNYDEFLNYFTPFLEDGKDILHVCISSGLSGAYTSAVMAKKDLEIKYPERKIYIVDSLAASAGQGLIMDTLADMRDAGKSIDEIYSWIENNKLRMHHWFYTDDLTFFIRGGRVSKVSGFIGTLFKICPVLNVDINGKLVPRLKVRTKAKCVDEVLEKMCQYAENGLDYNKKCFISNANCLEDAKLLANKINEKFKKLNGDVVITDIGTTIGSHTGTGTVALFFWGTPRKD